MKVGKNHLVMETIVKDPKCSLVIKKSFYHINGQTIGINTKLILFYHL